MKQKAWPTILYQSTNVMLETAGNERLVVQRSFLRTYQRFCGRPEVRKMRVGEEFLGARLFISHRLAFPFLIPGILGR